MSKFRIRVTTELEVDDKYGDYKQPMSAAKALSLVDDVKWTIEAADLPSVPDFKVIDINVEFLDDQSA